MKRIGGLVALGALAFAGCTRPSGEATSPAPKTNVEVTVPGRPGASPPVVVPGDPKSSPAKPGAVKSPTSSRTPGTAEIPMPKFQPKTFEPAKPNTEGWKATSTELASLGAKMDEALTKSKDLWAKTNTLFEISGRGTLASGKADVKIQNADRFRVEYYLPDTEATLHAEVKNGGPTAELAEEGWKKAPRRPAPSVNEWSQVFPREVFATLTQGRPAWSEFLRRLEKGEDGFRTHIEKRTRKVAGAEHPYLRVLAERPKTTIEMIVDGERYLPLTIRVSDESNPGNTRKGLWSAEWKSGGVHDPKAFVLPKSL